MKFLNYICICFIFCITALLVSCNTDYLNNTPSTNKKNITSNNLFDILSTNLQFPKFKSLNEDELLTIYAIDPKILIDYVANIPNDSISATEISIFRLKDKTNTTEAVLGIQRRVKELENNFENVAQTEYNLIKNPYIKIFNNYVVFALYEDTEKIDKILSNEFK